MVGRDFLRFYLQTTFVRNELLGDFLAREGTSGVLPENWSMCYESLRAR